MSVLTEKERHFISQAKSMHEERKFTAVRKDLAASILVLHLVYSAMDNMMKGLQVLILFLPTGPHSTEFDILLPESIKSGALIGQVCIYGCASTFDLDLSRMRQLIGIQRFLPVCGPVEIENVRLHVVYSIVSVRQAEAVDLFGK